MKVSLVVTVKNEEDNIEDFLRSVISQSKKPNELIVVDGGSEDRTYEILKKYAKRYKWIKVFQLKGASIGKGRNFGIEVAKNEIVAVTNAGCILDKNWLKNITAPFERDEVECVIGAFKPYHTNEFEYFQGLVVVPKPEELMRKYSKWLCP